MVGPFVSPVIEEPLLNRGYVGYIIYWLFAALFKARMPVGTPAVKYHFEHQGIQDLLGLNT